MYSRNLITLFGAMRRLFASLTIVVSCAFSANAQNVGFDAYVEEYGQLKDALGMDWIKIDSLVVHGPIDASDFNTMWRCAFNGNLKVINLENAQVKDNRIPDYALCNMQNLVYLDVRRIILPDNIVEIGKSAFCYMKLEQINLPASLRKLNIYCFQNCMWLNVDPLVIPEGVTEIPGVCFANCQSLKRVVLPSSLRTISDMAFNQNIGMTEISLPANLDSIGLAAFEGCTSLTKVEIPDACRKLGSMIFNQCSSLREIHIPEGLERIPNSIAVGCTSLETVNIPESVIEIGSNAFQQCSKLKDIKLPDGLRRIRGYAFFGCNPDSVVFGESLESIGGGSCSQWANIKKIYSKSSTPPACADNPCFSGTPTDIPVYVPVGCAEVYRNAQGWNHFTNFVEMDFSHITGISGVRDDSGMSSAAYWSNGCLNMEVMDEASLPLSYSIYTIGGQRVEQGSLSSPHHSSQMPKGMYVVRIGNDVHKVR